MLKELKQCVREIAERRLAEKEAAGAWQPSVTRREVVEELREGIIDAFTALHEEGQYRFFPSGVNQEPALMRKEAG